MDLRIVYLDPKELKAYEGNARKHAPRDIEQIKESIKADGFNDPIGVWGDENIIVEGHGRQLAAIEMGLEKVPCIRLDHLTDTQRRDYAIRHNRTAELSEWDEMQLAMERAALEIEGVDFKGLFDEMDLLGGGGKSDKEKGEVEFTEELMLTHNYIVLYFDNDFDWAVAVDKFGIKKVKDLIPRKGQPTGIGRVIDGKKVLGWLN